MNNVKIHPLAEVHSNSIGNNTQVWQFAIILEKAQIGENCNINCHTFIENDVTIGNRVTVKSGVFLWDGIEIADDVFLGPNVTFINDKYPRSKNYPEAFQKTIIENSVSIGAGSIILGGLTIGKFALIGAGCVVTKNVPPYSLMLGNPARIVGEVDKKGNVVRRF